MESALIELRLEYPECFNALWIIEMCIKFARDNPNATFDDLLEFADLLAPNTDAITKEMEWLQKVVQDRQRQSPRTQELFELIDNALPF